MTRDAVTCKSVLHSAALFFGAVLVAGVLGTVAVPAQAQTIVATVNDSPVTNYDLEQRMKFLRVLRKNASREAALESIVEDRLKLAEINKYGLKPSDQDAAGEVARIAAANKIPPQSLGGAMQAAHVDTKHWQEHGRAQVGWRGLVSALNKTVGVSETEVREEVAKRGGKKNNNEYRMRQIILVVPTSAGAAAYENRMREAEGLRTRFTSCDSGVQLARGLKDVAVKEQISRSGATMSDQLAEVLERTPVGRLTPPQRSATGIEMIAICGKGAEGSDGAAAQEVRQTLLSKKLETAGVKLYEPLRKRAVIVRR